MTARITGRAKASKETLDSNDAFFSGMPADPDPGMAFLARPAGIGGLNEGAQFIQKPFSMKDLAAKVREVLGPWR